MASNIKRKSNGFVEEIVAIENVDVSTYNEIGHRKLRCKFPANIKLVGLSGKQYEWKGAGTIVEVDDADVDFLLLKKVGTGACCGGSNQPNYLFEEVR